MSRGAWRALSASRSRPVDGSCISSGNTGWLRFRNLQAGGDHRVHRVTNVNSNGERGALGVAVHPAWPNQPFVYVFVTRNTTEGLRNQVLRIKVANGQGTAVRRILSSPAGPASNHNGGRILFGPDNKLYVVIGDNADPANSQDRSSNLRGKILRVNPDGSIPATNPFGTRIWAYGIRNSIGFAFDPQNARLWESENGPACNDEVNRIVKGGNHGWGPNENCPNTNNSGPTPRILPKHTFASTVGLTGLAFCDACGLGAGYQGDLLARSRERRKDPTIRPERHTLRLRRRSAPGAGSTGTGAFSGGRAQQPDLLQRFRGDLPLGTGIEGAERPSRGKACARYAHREAGGGKPGAGRPPPEDSRGHRPSQARDRDRAGIAAGP